MDKPFSPALNAAMNLLQQRMQQDLTVILQEEAKSLGLPEGWKVDVEKRSWRLPDAPSAPTLVKE